MWRDGVMYRVEANPGFTEQSLARLTKLAANKLIERNIMATKDKSTVYRVTEVIGDECPILGRCGKDRGADRSGHAA